MEIIHWAFSQLVSYGLVTWVLFIAISFACAYFLRVPGIVCAHVLVAIAIVVLDIRWIQSEIRKPDWDGQPDQDFVFMIGMLLRILLINLVLLPVSLIALRLRRSGKSHSPATDFGLNTDLQKVDDQD